MSKAARDRIAQCRRQQLFRGDIPLYVDMHVPNRGQNGPVMKAGVEESCLPETRLTSHQTV